MAKRILITGAAGFVGSNLVDFLLKDGCKVEDLILIVAPWDSMENLSKYKGKVITADIRDKNELSNVFKNVDVVYHLAAKTVIDDGTYQYYKDTNIDGTDNLLKLSKEHKVKKFIYFSSISVFGLPAWRGDMENCSENWPKNYSEPYGRTKLEGEKLVQKSKLPYIIIRPTTVYGPRDKAGLYQMYKAISKNLFMFIGNGKNKMDYVYVEDLVRAARMAEKSTIVNEDFIIGAGVPTTQQALAKSVAKSINKNIPNIYIPKWFAILASFVYEKISKLFNINPLFFPKRVKVLTSNCYFDIHKANRVLKFFPKYDIQSGTQKTGEWLIKNKVL